MTWRWFIGMKLKTARRRLARWIAPTPEATGTIIMNNVLGNTYSSAGIRIDR